MKYGVARQSILVLLHRRSTWCIRTYYNNTSSSSYYYSSSSWGRRLFMIGEKCKTREQIKELHAQMIISSSSLTQQHDDTFIYNTLIRANATSSNPTHSLSLYIHMRTLGVLPGKHTFPFLLKACSTLRLVRFCKQVHTHVFKHGFDSDLHVGNGLVRVYSVCRKLRCARKVFDEMPERNLTIWTMMICGYAQNNGADEALGLFDRMVVSGFEPNGATLASVLSACARSGCLDLGGRIHIFMREKGFKMGVILGTALVHMYAKNGAISMAQKCFKGLTERNVATWNAMICGLATHGHAEEALNLFKELKKENIVPNDITLVGVLSACCHAGFTDLGREIFYSMKRVYGIDPKIEHYSCMVDILGRSGKLKEAEELIRGMIWKADIVIWGALLSACNNNGDIDVAERVVEEMLVLEPRNHGVYIILSNMYAEVGRWEDVARLRDRMKVDNLKKTPGWSLVDGDN